MSTPRNRVLCQACKAALRQLLPPPSDAPVRTKHHSSHKSLRDALINGCVICYHVHRVLEPDKTLRKSQTYIHAQIGNSTLLSFSADTTKNTSECVFFYVMKPPNGIDEVAAAPLLLSPAIFSAETFALMSRWYNDCFSKHDYCTHRQNTMYSNDFQRPTRLIDIGPPGSLEWRLRITSQDPLVCIESGYLTLSHRWGSSPFIQLTSSTVERFRQGLPIATLPTTFRDAILIGHHLGIRYIWIDSLCIEQDSQRDWMREAPNMHLVYGQAHVNIVAAYSEGPEDGLFRHRAPGQAELIICDEAETYLLWDYRRTENELIEAPLAKRGWVFQERLLAPRILYFGEDQVYWRCRELFSGETFPFGIVHVPERPFDPTYMAKPGRNGTCFTGLGIESVDAFITGGLSQPDWLLRWTWLCTEYSACTLTHPEDKLVALSGIVKLIRKATGYRYLAGLWEPGLAMQLCWERRDSKEEAHHRPQSYRAPTWSWMSIDDAVLFYVLTTNWTSLIDILEVVVVPFEDDETVQLRGGHLKVVGYLSPYELVKTTDIVFDSKLDSDPRGLNLWILPVEFEFGLTRVGVPACGSAMVLQEMRNSTYQRVGHTFIDADDDGDMTDFIGVTCHFDDNSKKLVFGEDAKDKVRYGEITIV